MKKNIKKLLCIFMAFGLLFSLAACDEDEDDDDDRSFRDKTNFFGNNPKPAVSRLDDFNEEGTIEKTCLYSQDDVLIYADSLTYDNNAAILELSVENNTSQTLSVELLDNPFAINGHFQPSQNNYFSLEIESQKTETDSLSLSYSDLMCYGIDGLTHLRLGFSIEKGESDAIKTGPLLLKTSLADTEYADTPFPERIQDERAQKEFGYELLYFSDDPIYDHDGMTVLSHCVINKTDGRQHLLLEVENQGSKDNYLYNNKLALNGLTVGDGYFSWYHNYISPGHRTVLDLTLTSDLSLQHWEVYGLREIATIGLSLETKNTDETNVLISLPATTPSFDTSGTTLYSDENIQVIYKTIYQSSYSSDVYALLLVKNQSDSRISLSTEEGTYYINGTLVEESYSYDSLEAGEYAVLKLGFWELDGLDLDSVEDVTSFSAKLEVSKSYYTEYPIEISHKFS